MEFITQVRSSGNSSLVPSPDTLPEVYLTLDYFGTLKSHNFSYLMLTTPSLKYSEKKAVVVRVVVKVNASCIFQKLWMLAWRIRAEHP